MFCGLAPMLCNISNILIAVSCLHTFCFLDYGPYPYYGGDCLDPCVLQWSHYFGGDGLESDPGVAIIGDVACIKSQTDAVSESVPSVQGRLKQYERFWLDELEPSSFVAGIITEGYRLPFLRLPDRCIIGLLWKIPCLYLMLLMSLYWVDV